MKNVMFEQKCRDAGRIFMARNSAEGKRAVALFSNPRSTEDWKDYVALIAFTTAYFGCGQHGDRLSPENRRIFA